MFYQGQKKRKGFTLLEVIITVGISVLVLAFGFKAFVPLANQQLLKKELGDVEVLLQEARSKTISAVESTNYGVYFENTKVTLFKGEVFSELDPENEEIILDSRVNISNINLGGGSAVVFEKLTGDVNYPGTVTLSLISDPSKSKVITIEPTGSISSN